MDSVGVVLFPVWVLLSWGEEPEKDNNDAIFLAVMLLENSELTKKWNYISWLCLHILLNKWHDRIQSLADTLVLKIRLIFLPRK